MLKKAGDFLKHSRQADLVIVNCDVDLILAFGFGPVVGEDFRCKKRLDPGIARSKLGPGASGFHLWWCCSVGSDGGSARRWNLARQLRQRNGHRPRAFAKTESSPSPRDRRMSVEPHFGHDRCPALAADSSLLETDTEENSTQTNDFRDPNLRDGFGPRCRFNPLPSRQLLWWFFGGWRELPH